MKIRSLIWKTGCAVVIGVICSISPSLGQSVLPSSSSGTPTPPGPPIVFPSSPLGVLCDRLTNTICIPSTPTRSSIGDLDDKITKDVCAYAKCSPPSPVTFAFVQDAIQKSAQVTDSATALVYPNVFPDRIEILIVPSSGKEIRKVVPNVQSSEVTETVQEFLNSLRDSSNDDYLPLSQKLYNWIIRPIDEDLQSEGIKTLIFVMDGSLRSIPISALHDGNKFVVQKYATATIPSMGLVNLQLRDRRRSSILVMGLTQAQQGFTALPNVEVETKVIAARILQGNLFLNQDFTIDNHKKQQSKNNYGIVHLATHAQFLSDNIDGAFIQFWNERLSLNDLRSIRLGEEPIEMLTLSACETAVGKNLGLSGVALVYKSKSVLASLWTVSDAGTTPLMLSFYSYYPTSKSKAIAIQQAQLDLLEGKVRVESGQIKGVGNLPAIPLSQVTGNINLKHPYFWASFVLVGNWL
jgi:CHAT domain-containing protein